MRLVGSREMDRNQLKRYGSFRARSGKIFFKSNNAERTLTPPVLVRIQVPQPIGIQALFLDLYSEQQA